MGRFLQLDHVTFAYSGMADPLLRGVSALFTVGTWTGVVGANGAGKTTLLKLAAGELTPTEGFVRTLGTAQYVVQRTDAQTPALDEFMNAWDPVAMDVRHPALQVRPDDRIAPTGDNGIGKTTLVRCLLTRANVEPDRMLVIPQEISEVESRAIHEAVEKLDDGP